MKDFSILVFIEKQSPRAEFIFELLLSKMLGLDFRFEENFQNIKNGTPFINYTSDASKGGFHILPEGILNENILRSSLDKFTNRENPVLFPTEGKDLKFDIFSASFYLVSRYEEYLRNDPDSHGRFRPQSSILYQAELLQKPVVNIWVHELKEALMKKYPELKFDLPKFRYLSTIDVDSAFCFLGKGFSRTLGGILKDFFRWKLRRITERLAVISGLKADPFDNFELQDDIHNRIGMKPLYFILFTYRSKYNKGIAPHNQSFRNLLKRVSFYHTLGLHPGYSLSFKKSSLLREKKRLEKVLSKPILQSRQHYLRFELPITYQNLLSVGIREDYSMGYASTTGFRAGIAFPFNFFDLSKNEKTELMVYPSVLMDVTLKNYMRLNTDKAIAEIRSLMNIVYQYNGLFISIWHNETFSGMHGWIGWNAVYEAMARYAAKLKNDQSS